MFAYAVDMMIPVPKCFKTNRVVESHGRLCMVLKTTGRMTPTPEAINNTKSATMCKAYCIVRVEFFLPSANQAHHVIAAQIHGITASRDTCRTVEVCAVLHTSFASRLGDDAI